MITVDYLKELGLSEYIISEVIKLVKQNEEIYSKYVDGLTSLNKAEETYLKIKNDFKDDYKCFNVLCIYLLASQKTFKLYKEKGISTDIFIDTFKCIARFINECKEINKEEYFDRDFWVWRQLSLRLFRLGELEYELTNDFGFSVSVHIPSDAVLTKEKIDDSLGKLHSFLKQFYKEYYNQIIYCDSWLLSPELKKYLDSNSRILLFQSYFKITKVDLENKGFIRWLFKCSETTKYEDLICKTSLQKKVKQALINKEKIGEALGFLLRGEYGK